jgi:hypothetical protein
MNVPSENTVGFRNKGKRIISIGKYFVYSSFICQEINLGTRYLVLGTGKSRPGTKHPEPGTQNQAPRTKHR